ncbi:FAD-dependent oxidoreductase [Sphingomonas ginkgonis]|uniref:FAD-dependent oxidoreductase n=2 Tax=Sphingomonas ginkgonis TaxID=2315330 RepID=A0A429VDZ4_9SPHN|nr:FAD-dependent oxidoreductase [Sphingomonas ginkgonis]
MAGLLFARVGVRVQVVEKHGDFLHDFRGDTVHPSTMAVLGQLGLLDAFLARPHQRLSRAELRIAGQDMIVGDLSRVPGPTPFVAMVPQWEFLDFLRREASRLDTFRMDMACPVERLIEEDGRIAGARLAGGDEIRAGLTIAADGRRSIVRRDSLLPVKDLGSPIDVFWFELPKRNGRAAGLKIAVDGGRILVRVDRGSYWQCALVFPKGRADKLKARGIAAIRTEIEAVDSRLGRLSADLASLDDLHLLEVSLDRLTRWHRPGLLAIGDAAHAMSPMGGIGINLAIQDAVAAANLLAPALAGGADVDALLHKVQRRRHGSTRLIQLVQKIAQDWVLAPMLGRGKPISGPPLPLLLLQRFPALRRIPGRAIALGIRQERVAA